MVLSDSNYNMIESAGCYDECIRFNMQENEKALQPGIY